jgi:hypothetical protein
MPVIMRDETAGVDILYIDNAGQIGLMGSANGGQALSFAGFGVVSGTYFLSNSIAGPGSPSPLTGTVVIPVSSSATVGYSVPQIPTVTASSDPTAVSTGGATFTNTSTTDAQTITYKIW